MHARKNTNVDICGLVDRHLLHVQCQWHWQNKPFHGSALQTQTCHKKPLSVYHIRLHSHTHTHTHTPWFTTRKIRLKCLDSPSPYTPAGLREQVQRGAMLLASTMVSAMPLVLEETRVLACVWRHECADLNRFVYKRKRKKGYIYICNIPKYAHKFFHTTKT